MSFLSFLRRLFRSRRCCRSRVDIELDKKSEGQDSPVNDLSESSNNGELSTTDRKLIEHVSESQQPAGLQIPPPKRIGVGGKAHGGGTQDAFFVDKNIVAIADGVGESIGSEIASDHVTKMFVSECSSLGKDNIDFKSINEVWLKLDEMLKELYKEKYENANFDFTRVLTGFLATTLLSVIELEDSYIISYLGNGSIWYVRGDFWEFLESRRKWPWCIEDILIPHSSYAGDEALFGVIDSTGIRGTPSIISIKKDTERGEIFILTTDGISSKDKIRVLITNGSNGDQIPKSQEINHNIFKILCIIRDYLNNYKSYSYTLDDLINKFLDENNFDDDATLAILISEKAIQYFAMKHNYL